MQFTPAMIELALTVILKYAPQAYVAAVAFFSKAEPTKEDEAALTATLVRLVNPAGYYPPGTPPVTPAQ